MRPTFSAPPCCSCRRGRRAQRVDAEQQRARDADRERQLETLSAAVAAKLAKRLPRSKAAAAKDLIQVGLGGGKDLIQAGGGKDLIQA
eukprot:gene636-30736_t